MLCPETWNFEPLPHYTAILHLDVMKNANAIALVKSHYFNHSISVVLPNTVTVPQNLHNCLSKDTDYYRINKLHVSDLLNIEFIEAFVKKGEINLLTLENKIDLENSICVTPTGYLILSLLTDDYQALGLEGKPSVFSHKSHTRYNISMCPSSIAAWFYARNYNVCLCCQKFSQKIKYSLTIPTYEDTCNNTDIDFFEWLGVFSIDGDLSTKREDNYANTYQCPSPSIHVKQVQYLQWTGFFTRQKIQEVYNVLKQYILSRDSLPWISLDIQGFADSAISFDLKEHTFLTDGDNSYTIVFHPKGKVVIRRNLSSNSKIKVHR
ncbi:PREDICTED: ribonuclease P protein subunit p40-like isoform X2 [Acromyrmex echinatior]|uniref:ribonuclease P protein subunit p40-like isoform X2 n=1 Tax=Acromyrmex echinatior TaxID=103372 RepID=UPI000580F4D7|nr:PREDICTED: ribonuclease P protein subunit p40-like isoform X2 [Acromyrmex echinatior]